MLGDLSWEAWRAMLLPLAEWWVGPRRSSLKIVVMNQTPFQILLDYARNLAAFGLHDGQMHEAIKLLESVAALEAKPEPEKEVALIAQLRTEMDELRQAIGPDRLIQLVRRQSRTRRMLGVGTFLLILYLGFHSLQLYEADTVLREYEEVVAQQPKEKLYAAFKMYHFEHVMNVKTPPLAQLDAYQKMVEDIHRIASKEENTVGLLHEAATLNYVPPILEMVFPYLPARLNQTQVRLDPDELLNLSDLREGTSSSGTTQKSLPTDCKNDPLAQPDKLETAQRSSSVTSDIDAYEAYKKSWACFLNRITIDENLFDYPSWYNLHAIRSKINMLVTWILPGLYGLLGACVYLMRNMMRPGNKEFDLNNPVLNKLSLPLRIVLGGLAGIIIGWFSVPAIGNGSTAAISPMPAISSIPFGIAFLAGFSIESLFSILDRLTKAIETSEAKKPA